jgi:3-keto-disaccharide hydrolase
MGRSRALAAVAAAIGLPLSCGAPDPGTNELATTKEAVKPPPEANEAKDSKETKPDAAPKPAAAAAAKPAGGAEGDFTSRLKSCFDGNSLAGWKLVGGEGPGYVVKDGLIVCPKDGGGNLFLEQEFSDFAFTVEFRTEPGGNNGVGIRAPYEGDAAYVGMEIQVLDDFAPQYAHLLPGQYCGSVYKVSPVKRGALKPAGDWNQMQIWAVGRHVKVWINGVLSNDVDLNTVTDPETIAEHPGMWRERGHIGFLGHQSLVEFRNPMVADLSTPASDNVPPAGFTALFDGKDLANWKGLVSPDKGPPGRAAMTPDQLKAAQVIADQQMRDHWSVVDGTLHYDGNGQSLCTLKDYRNFELWVDWKIEKDGDSGIYLRGSPQVQIWDKPVGSGGLFNNKKGPHDPLVVADKPVGEWNHFRIVMVGDKVTVYLNEQLVVHDTTLENAWWEKDKPIYPTGQIELQHHNSTLWFKNVYLRELPEGK